jgi:uncharacterized protein YndB with AHSA1/START domain
MGEYRAEATVDAPVERAFAVFIDATRFSQWQAMAVRAFDQSGPLSSPGSTVRIDHGPAMKRTMTILEADPPHRIRFDQDGMGLHDTTTVTFDGEGERSRVTMTSELRVAGGVVGRVLERLSVGQNRAEYQRELDRFAAVAARRPVDPGPPGGLITADSGAGFRVLKVLAVDPEVVHVALLPGVAKRRPTDLAPHLDGTSHLDDPLALRPLEVSIRGAASKIVSGQPFLRLDGGVGVPHLALTPDAFGDARPEPAGDPIDVWDHEIAEIESWRRVGGPVLGRGVDTGLTTLMTVKAEDGYGAVKLLHADRNAVHLRFYSERWGIPPEEIDPWALRLGRIDDPVVGIGHFPLTRRSFGGWEPRFDRVVMLDPIELDGYRAWLEAGGGIFT